MIIIWEDMGSKAGRRRALRKEIGLTQQSVLFGGLFVVTPASLFLHIKVSKSYSG